MSSIKQCNEKPRTGCKSIVRVRPRNNVLKIILKDFVMNEKTTRRNPFEILADNRWLVIRIINKSPCIGRRLSERFTNAPTWRFQPNVSKSLWVRVVCKQFAETANVLYFFPLPATLSCVSRCVLRTKQSVLFSFAFLVFFVFFFFRGTLHIFFVFWRQLDSFFFAHIIFTHTYKILRILFFVYLTLNVFLLYLFGTVSHYFCETVVSVSPWWSGRPELNSEYTSTQPKRSGQKYNKVFFLFFLTP